MNLHFYCILFINWKWVKSNGARMVEVCKQNQWLYCSRCLKCYSCLKEKKKQPCHLKMDVVRLHWPFTTPCKAAAEWKSGIQHVLWFWWYQLTFPYLGSGLGGRDTFFFSFCCYEEISFWIYKVVKFVNVSGFILLQTDFSEQSTHLIAFKLHILFKETQNFNIICLQDDTERIFFIKSFSWLW